MRTLEHQPDGCCVHPPPSQAGSIYGSGIPTTPRNPKASGASMRTRTTRGPRACGVLVEPAGLDLLVPMEPDEPGSLRSPRELALGVGRKRLSGEDVRLPWRPKAGASPKTSQQNFRIVVLETSTCLDRKMAWMVSSDPPRSRSPRIRSVSGVRAANRAGRLGLCSASRRSIVSPRVLPRKFAQLFEVWVSDIV